MMTEKEIQCEEAMVRTTDQIAAATRLFRNWFYCPAPSLTGRQSSSKSGSKQRQKSKIGKSDSALAFSCYDAIQRWIKEDDHSGDVRQAWLLFSHQRELCYAAPIGHPFHPSHQPAYSSEHNPRILKGSYRIEYHALIFLVAEIEYPEQTFSQPYSSSPSSQLPSPGSYPSSYTSDKGYSYGSSDPVQPISFSISVEALCRDPWADASLCAQWAYNRCMALSEELGGARELRITATETDTEFQLALRSLGFVCSGPQLDQYDKGYPPFTLSFLGRPEFNYSSVPRLDFYHLLSLRNRQQQGSHILSPLPKPMKGK